MPANWAPLIRDLVESRQIPETAPGIVRDIRIETLPAKATILIGVRRAGKSTQMAGMMAALRQQGVPRGDILYIDFFDERLAGFGKENFQELIDAFLAERGSGRGKVYAFFDEIQETDGWEGFVHRVQQHHGWQVYLTGSSSRMLSGEMATRMRGRSLSFELFPYSFAEYLRAREMPGTVDSDESRAVISRACEDYLAEGGFPEAAGRPESVRIRLHQEYFSSILQRDLVMRNDTAHPAAVRDLTHRLMHDNGSLQSVNRLFDSLKAGGHAISKPFVSECLDWMHDAFLAFPVHIHTRSATKRKANPCKWYSIDTGMVRSVASKFSTDRGRMLETLIFLALRRQGIRPAYHRTASGKEIDFVHQAGGDMHLIQVCWEMADPATRKRELAALEEGIRELKPKAVSLVTWNDDFRVEAAGRLIEAIPAWRFLLRQPRTS